jgi:hypothetical protein
MVLLRVGLGDEGAIDLDDVERQLLQAGQRGASAAEVVAPTECQPPSTPAGWPAVERRVRPEPDQVQLQLRRLHAVRIEHGNQFVRQPRLAQLHQ